MSLSISISLSEEDIDKMKYVEEAIGFKKTRSGYSGIVKLCIQKAYAHQKQIDLDKEIKTKNINIENIDNSVIKQLKSKIW